MSLDAQHGWHHVDPTIREVAESVCTPQQLDALKLLSHGYGSKRSARILGVSRDAVRYRIEAGSLRIEKELALRNNGGTIIVMETGGTI